jgi:MYXO-CTERM domain-containing protein
VISEQVVGDYQTVTFRANEAQAATQWLRDNGFIVNPTTTLYMEPYVAANMVFVAAKLVPGAGVDSIKPLRMRFRAPFPMIPLVLTAVAAEPHLTVTAFIYGNLPFRPMGHPVVSIDPARIAQDRDGRSNYPMVLARTVDEAGGDGFAVEYRGVPARPEFGQATQCCDGEWDFCGVGDNEQCECPRDEFDRNDCDDVGDVIEGVALLDDLAARHTRLTRLTTRISPEEMRFDPTFEPDAGAPLFGRMQARGAQASLDRCWTRVIDQDAYAEIDVKQDCAAVYCGTGQCVTTESGAACACDAGTVARRFIDLDGKPSVTCIPEEPTVDLGAGGLPLPDACADLSCGMGACQDRNGIPVCACNGGAGAVAGDTGPIPRCEPISGLTQTPGAEDFSEPLRPLLVCAPPLAACDAGGWFEKVPSPRVGVDCGDATPTAEQQEPGPEPTCDGARSIYGCGCGAGHPAGALGLAWIVGFLLMRRRRRPA